MVASLADALLWTAVAVLSAGAACVAYGVLLERRWYRVATYRVPVLPGGSHPIRVLHLSDLHFVRRDRRKASFLAGLPAPDVVVATGDLLGEPEAVEGVVAALRPLRGRVASYVVLGSNDYFAPRPLNPLSYFRRPRKHRPGIRGRADELVRSLEAEGWTDIRNARTGFGADGVRADVVGLDDAHIERHDLRVASGAGRTGFGMAVLHSPDPVPELVALGWDLVLSGHTHGGQVRMPVLGALVTNSQLPTRLCMGLSRFGDSYLHVSPGLGTSKYAPFRFLCRPEATVLELVAR